jgi:SAM-dependent methyltransferase
MYSVCIGNVEGELPFADDTFSMSLCIEVVEHLLQPDLMISEIHRVLKLGGFLLITTPNYAYWVLRMLYLFGRLPVGLNPRQWRYFSYQLSLTNPPPWRDPHIRFFSPAILRRFLNEHGFVVETVRSGFVAFPSGLASYLPFVLGLPLRIIGKPIGNLDFLGDYFPALHSVGLLVRAVKR